MAAESQKFPRELPSRLPSAQSADAERWMGELLLRQSWLAGGWWTSLSISKQQLLKGSPLKKMAGAPGLVSFGGAAAPPVGILNFVLLIRPRTAD